MNKPKIIYAIAIWSFFQTPFYVSIPVEILGTSLMLSPEFITIVKFCGQIGSIGIIVGLVQLKRVPRIIMVILLSIATLLSIKILITVFFMETGLPLRTYISVTIIPLINILCIWYLLRKKVIDFSSEYRKDVERRKHLNVMKI